MQNTPVHEIELYPPEAFKALLEHEVNRSQRYGDSLTLVDILVEADPATPETQHSAQVYAINVLNLHLRDVDIPSRKDNEFLIMMPSTGAPGARTACERLRKLMTTEQQTRSGIPFKLIIFAGMATLPLDLSISSDEFSKNASFALQHARMNLFSSAVAYSDIPK